MNGKNDLLEREIKKYNDDMIALNNENSQLNDHACDVKNQYLLSEKNVDDLRNLNSSSSDELKAKMGNLEDMKQDASDMALHFENELVFLNKK